MNCKILLLAAWGSLYMASCQNKPTTSQADSSNVSTVTTPAPVVNDDAVFKKEGVLSFIGKEKGDTIKTIDIEIAETDEERAKGLMDRTSMTDEQGMLFIFAEAEEQSFWMKNTYISLDIMYVGADQEIVSIQKYATPLSEESLPSFKKAKYVVETNAGFADKYKVKYGDKIAFSRN